MSEPPKEPVKYVEATLRLPYHYVAGDYRARYLLALKDKKILGSKCSTTGKVFVPPLVASPESFAPCEELVQVADRGVVTTFCIVRIPVIGRNVELPYVAASVALDGADTALAHVVKDDLERLRVGARVEVVWAVERTGTIRDLECFRVTR